MTHRKTQVSKLASFLLAMAAGTAVLSVPAHAQDAPAGRIDLVDQSDWVGENQPFSMGLNVQSPLPADQLEVVVTVSPPVSNRSEFQQTLDNRQFSSGLFTERRPLDEIRGPDGLARIDLPVRDAQQRRYLLNDGGVYPVRVELRSSSPTRTVDQFTTHLINVTQVPAADTRLRVSTLVPIVAPVTRDDALSEADPRPFDVASNALRSQPQLPMTLVPSPETLDRVDAGSDSPSAAALGRAIDANGGRPVLGSTWVPLSSAMFSPPLGTELNRQFDRARRSLDQRFPNRDNTTGVITEPLDTAALAQWETRGARRFLVSESALAPLQGTTVTRPFAVPVNRAGRTLPAVQTDGRLARHFLDPRGQVLGAHRALADLTVVWNEAPGQLRGIVVAPPKEWLPNDDFYRVYTRALASSPLLAGTNVDEVFALPAEGGGRGRVRQSATLPRAFVSEFPYERINDLRTRINGLRSSTLPNSPLVDRLDRRLLYSESAVLNTTQRNRALEEAVKAVNNETGSIRLPPERSIRLTARRGEVPVSVLNDTGEPVEVVARLSGENVDFPGGGTRRLSVDRQQLTERFTVDARTSGVFPVQIRLESPDGSIVYARSRVLIGSTATSALGVVLSVSAGAFLLLWWVRGLVRGRKEAAS